MTLESITATLLIGMVIGYLLPRLKARFTQPPSAPDAAPPAESPDGTARLYELARETKNYFESTAHPRDLLDHPTFQEGVRMLSSKSYTDGQLLEYYAGGNVLIGCMALEALRNRVLTEEDHLKQAAVRFAGAETNPVVVRRYRWEPSPLVRDAIRNYRTGRIDKVMDGDFDLFG